MSPLTTNHTRLEFEIAGGISGGNVIIQKTSNSIAYPSGCKAVLPLA